MRRDRPDQSLRHLKFAVALAEIILLASWLTIGLAPSAQALPSFARQTGQPCGTCHTDYPALTPFGRRFKLLGYTAGEFGEMILRDYIHADDCVRAEALFGELAVDGFFLEFDDERSGGFAPLRFVPPGKMVVLGLVTTKRPGLESADDLKRRIDEAARFVPLDQLCLSGQCGFSSTVEGNELTYDEQVAKLRLIVSVARDVWG